MEELADKVQDFSFDLLEQVEKKEDYELQKVTDADADRYGSLFSGITDNAIGKGQKKVPCCYITLKNISKT